MKTPKTISIIACRRCGGEYFAGERRITLHPGTESELPDELEIVLRKVPKCTSCQQAENRTAGGTRRRFNR